MSLYKKIFSILCYFLIPIAVSAQETIKGVVVEKSTRLPIAFASVTYMKQSVQKGVISDVHGKFEIKDSGVRSITVSCVGYGQEKVTIGPGTHLSGFIVELKTDTVNIGVVIITPANNPALRIIRKALENKNRNNFENYERYRYRCYLKTFLNLKISYNATAADSLTIRKNRDFNKRASFISESVILCSRINNLSEARIIALKTSGFENPVPGQYFATSFQNAISFYNNNISLFAIPVSYDKTAAEYISPLSDECLRSYNFSLEETLEDMNDTIWLIEYHPKKGKNFNSLKGKMYISSNGYAIRNIVTEPDEKGLIDFKFKQDYEFINGKWFPSRLNEEIGFVSVQISKKIKAYPVYLITSEISNVDYNFSSAGDKINYEKVYLDKSMIKESDLILKWARKDSLTLIEKNTYQFMDSIGRKFKFDYWADLYPNLSAGRIPFRFIDIDLFKLYTTNKYEGTRPGFGVSTNDRLSLFFSLAGFAGYGIKDKKFKYGGSFTLYPGLSKETALKLSYQNNVREPGLDYPDEVTFLSPGNYFRDYIASRMDNIIETKAEFKTRLSRFIRFSAALRLREIKPAYEYAYKGKPLSDFYDNRIDLSVSFSPGELTGKMGNQQISYYPGNPVFTILYKRSISIFGRQIYPYNRIEGTIDITAYKGRIGQSDIRIAAGYVDRNVPYSLLFTGEGSKSNLPLLIKNTFQTMKPYEFLSDRYINVFYSHNFGSLLLETPRFKPRLVIVQNTGWGDLGNAVDHEIDFKTKDRIFLESGLLVNNLIRFKILNLYHIGFGGGTFFRYGYYRCDKMIDNLALKFSVTLSLE